MSKRNHIRWDAEGMEKIALVETENIQTVADMINASQKAQWNSHRHYSGGQSQRSLVRHQTLAQDGTHARIQGLVNGKLAVFDDLPKYLKQNLLEHGRESPVVTCLATQALM